MPNTDKNIIIWCDTKTHVVMIAKHVRFDEGMNDLPPDLIPPDAVHLQRTQNGEPLPAKTEETSVDQFTFHLNPFSCTRAKGVHESDDDPLNGLTLASDELSHCARATDGKENDTTDKMCAIHKSRLSEMSRVPALLVSMARKASEKTTPCPCFVNCMKNVPKISSQSLPLNKSSVLPKHDAQWLSTTSWNPVLSLMLIITISLPLLTFAEGPHFATHILTSRSLPSPQKKWKWSQNPFSCKQSPPLNSQSAALPGASFAH